MVALKIIKRLPLTDKLNLIENGISECNELISIFVKSTETTKRNNIKSKL